MNEKKRLEIFRQLHKGYAKGSAGQKIITTAGTADRITDQPTPIAVIKIRGGNTNTGLLPLARKNIS